MIDSSNNFVTGAVSLTPDALTATFTPSHGLSPNTQYTATITTGVTDQAGNPLISDKIWSFTTTIEPDITPPTIASKVPGQDVSDVDTSPTIKVAFSEKMLENTINKNTIKLFNEVGAEIIDTMVFLDPSDKDKKTVIITVTTPLEKGKKYKVRVTTGVKDLAGNAMPSQQEWSFSTKQG